MSTNRVHDTTRESGVRRARTTGLAVAAIGVLIFNVSPFLNWVSLEGEDAARDRSLPWRS